MNPSDLALREANRRQTIVHALPALMTQEGMSQNQAARVLGEDAASISRWRRAYEAHGFEGLIPKYRQSGRRSAVSKIGLTPEEALRIQGLALDLKSTVSACRVFAQSDGCREELAQVILAPRRSKHSIPKSIRNAVTPNSALHWAHAGPRTLALKGMWTPRKLDILPGDIFTSDDTTPIWGWWVPWIKCAEYPFGVKLLQGQLLPVMDVASQKVLNFVLIAREQSSYRAADIWRLFGHTFDTIGLPRLGLQLERGSWEANLIRGQLVESREGEATVERRVGGLRALPTTLLPCHHERFGARAPKTLQTWTSFLPKSKSIEAAFDRMQTLEGTLWGSLGRDQQRRPCEKAKKIYEACRRGAMDPREHFLSHLELTKRLQANLDYLNNEPMEGEVFHGRPAELWRQAIETHPLTRLSEDKAWMYRRDWRPRTITQGWVRVRLTDELTGQRYSLFYTNPAIFAEREGQAVVIYYDRENFEEPAQILDAQGNFLCTAEYFDRRGSFLDGDRSGHDIRRAWKNAVMATYGDVAPHAPSRQLPAEIATRRAAPPAVAEDEPAFASERSEEVRGTGSRADNASVDLVGAADHPRLSRDRGVSPVKREACLVSRSSDPAYMDRLERQFRRENPGILQP